MKIIDTPDDEKIIRELAEILLDGFSDTGTEAWSTLEECLGEAREFLKKEVNEEV